MHTPRRFASQSQRSPCECSSTVLAVMGSSDEQRSAFRLSGMRMKSGMEGQYHALQYYHLMVFSVGSDIPKPHLCALGLAPVAEQSSFISMTTVDLYSGYKERKTESISGAVYACDIQISFMRSGSEENL